jgi:hypothetical protein
MAEEHIGFRPCGKHLSIRRPVDNTREGVYAGNTKRRCNPATVGLWKTPPPEAYSGAALGSLLRQLRTARRASTQPGSNWWPDSEVISARAEACVRGSR